jgi:hypothetical protein
MDTYFVVTINSDGTFEMHSEVPENLEKSHEITISEIYTIVKQIVVYPYSVALEFGVKCVS